MQIAARLLVFVGMVGLLAGAGCHADTSVQSGRFLTSYWGLEQTPQTEGWYVWFSDSRPIDNYRAVTIAPLTVQLVRDAPTPISMTDMDAAEAAYRDALTQALTRDGRFRIVAHSGDGVLILRGFITDLYQRDSRRTVGRATMELEGLDSVTRHRVFAVVDPLLGDFDGEQHREPRVVFGEFAEQLRRQIDRHEGIVE